MAKDEKKTSEATQAQAGAGGDAAQAGATATGDANTAGAENTVQTAAPETTQDAAAEAAGAAAPAAEAPAAEAPAAAEPEVGNKWPAKASIATVHGGEMVNPATEDRFTPEPSKRVEVDWWIKIQLEASKLRVVED